jgi:hypothetical protein
MPTVEDMRRHVEKLLAGLSRADDYVEVRWIDRPTRAHASLEAGVITVPRIRSAISYATALHEVGHFLGRHQRSRSRLVRERWAWVWARRNARVWTPPMERHARESLDWYAARMEDDALCGLQPQQSAR